MYRGTTPTITFTVPFDTTLVQSVNVAFAQYSNMAYNLIFDKDVSLFEELRKVKLTLTQEETLKLTADTPVFIQLRVIFNDQTRAASNIVQTDVGRILKDGVI